MQITLRLNFPEDADLILMRANEKRSFCSRVMECVSSYAEGKRYVYRFPEDDGTYANLPQTEKINLMIRESRYPQAVSFLEKYGTGQRISLIKALLRVSYEKYPSGQILSALGFSELAREETSIEPAAASEKTVSFSKKAGSIKRETEKPSKGYVPKETVHKGEESSCSEKKTGDISQPIKVTGQPAAPSPVEVKPDGFESPEAVSPSHPDEEKERNLFEMFLNM